MKIVIIERFRLVNVAVALLINAYDYSYSLRPRGCIEEIMCNESARGADTQQSLLLLRDLVIAATEELDETETVAEGISHQRELAPLVRSDGLFEPCPSDFSSLHRRFDFINDKIKMDWRPVPLVTSPLRGCI